MRLLRIGTRSIELLHLVIAFAVVLFAAFLLIGSTISDQRIVDRQNSRFVYSQSGYPFPVLRTINEYERIFPVGTPDDLLEIAYARTGVMPARVPRSVVNVLLWKAVALNALVSIVAGFIVDVLFVVLRPHSKRRTEDEILIERKLRRYARSYNPIDWIRAWKVARVG